jgi:hypothetical protein
MSDQAHPFDLPCRNLGAGDGYESVLRPRSPSCSSRSQCCCCRSRVQVDAPARQRRVVTGAISKADVDLVILAGRNAAVRVTPGRPEAIGFSNLVLKAIIPATPLGAPRCVGTDPRVRRVRLARDVLDLPAPAGRDGVSSPSTRSPSTPAAGPRQPGSSERRATGKTLLIIRPRNRMPGHNDRASALGSSPVVLCGLHPSALPVDLSRGTHRLFR